LETAYPGVSFIEQHHFRQNVIDLIISPLHSTSQKIGLMLLFSLSWIGGHLEHFPKILLHFLSQQINRFRLKVQKYILRRSEAIIPNKEYVLFLVDDNIFIRDFYLKQLISLLSSIPNALGVSLRLGSNITSSYTRDRPLLLPEFTTLPNRMLKYDWTVSDGEFAYPLEVSSSLYRTVDIIPLIVGMAYKNPNELELQMARSAGEFRSKMMFLLCPDRSLTFCNPINMVQTVVPNRSGNNVYYSNEHLAIQFEQGYRIQVNTFKGFLPDSVHQEVDLEFYRSNAENGKNV